MFLFVNVKTQIRGRLTNQGQNDVMNGGYLQKVMEETVKG